jgi:hypothetical protein
VPVPRDENGAVGVHGLIEAKPVEKHAPSTADARPLAAAVVQRGRMTVPGVLALQRAAGNTATRRMLQRCGSGGCTCGGTCGGAGRHAALRTTAADEVGEPEADTIARKLAGAVAARSMHAGPGR